MDEVKDLVEAKSGHSRPTRANRRARIEQAPAGKNGTEGASVRLKTPPTFALLVTTDSELDRILTAPPPAMATVHLSKKAVTIPSTVRTLSSGGPVAPLVNLAARGGHDGHGHGHGASGPRSDTPARWAGGVSRTSSGLASKSFQYCE